LIGFVRLALLALLGLVFWTWVVGLALSANMPAVTAQNIPSVLTSKHAPMTGRGSFSREIWKTRIGTMACPWIA
jgi:hypothetical protein